MYSKKSIQKSIIYFVVTTIILFSNIDAQKYKMGLGYNTNIASKNFENSFLGFKTFLDIKIFPQFLFKTNFSLNLEDFKRTVGFKQLSSALFIPIEETLEYHLDYKNTEPYLGIGGGYYMLATNSFGIATPVVNTNFIVVDESLDNNWGYHFSFGVLFKKLNLFMEIKYIIFDSAFNQELDYQTVPFEIIKTTSNLSLNSLSLSFGYIFNL